MIGFWLSFLTGTTLFLSSIYALIVFNKVKETASTVRTNNFGRGILLMAFSLGANTLYWQVFGQPALHFELVTIDILRKIGFYLDFLLKGAGILGLYFSIKALRD